MYRPDIRSLRFSRGMTQEQVGLLAGMSKSQISRMEHGTLGSPDTYFRVLQALGYEPSISYVDVRQGNRMDRDTVLSLLKVYYLYNKDSFGIESIGLFGSYARGEAGLDSDIDVVISLSDPSLLKYASIQGQLEKIFKRKVDLLSSKSILPESFKEQLRKDVIYVSE